MPIAAYDALRLVVAPTAQPPARCSSRAKTGLGAKCGEFRMNQDRRVFCAWADGGSRGMVFWYYTPFEKAKRQLPEIRAAMVRAV